jgi:hypothetical protein
MQATALKRTFVAFEEYLAREHAAKYKSEYFTRKPKPPNCKSRRKNRSEPASRHFFLAEQ